jgi:hypothetical protein
MMTWLGPPDIPDDQWYRSHFPLALKMSVHGTLGDELHRLGISDDSGAADVQTCLNLRYSRPRRREERICLPHKAFRRRTEVGDILPPPATIPGLRTLNDGRSERAQAPSNAYFEPDAAIQA